MNYLAQPCHCATRKSSPGSAPTICSSDHKLTRENFPSYERYELGSQLRKAAYSVPANIAEGLARRQVRDRLHFLNIAETSLVEAGYCIHVAGRLDYISAPLASEIDDEIKRVHAPLAGLMRSIRNA